MAVGDEQGSNWRGGKGVMAGPKRAGVKDGMGKTWRGGEGEWRNLSLLGILTLL